MMTFTENHMYQFFSEAGLIFKMTKCNTIREPLKIIKILKNFDRKHTEEAQVHDTEYMRFIFLDFLDDISQQASEQILP